MPENPARDVHSAKSEGPARFLAGPFSLGFAGLPHNAAMRKNLSETTGLQRLTLGLVTGLLVAALPLPLGCQIICTV
jgi:hypothetical protein